MSWRPCSSAYEVTPTVQTSERLPTADDGPKVFAREKWSTKWFAIRWSDVVRDLHVEWRQLRLAEEVKKKGRAALRERQARKKGASPDL